MDHSDQEDRSEAIIQLLDWSDESRAELSKYIERARNKTKQDGKQHDATICGGTKGVTLMSCQLTEHANAMKRLDSYIAMKKYQQEAELWLGLLAVVDAPGAVHGFVIHDEPWIFNEKVEEFLKQYPLPFSKQEKSVHKSNELELPSRLLVARTALPWYPNPARSVGPRTRLRPRIRSVGNGALRR